VTNPAIEVARLSPRKIAVDGSNGHGCFADGIAEITGVEFLLDGRQ
jgi:hypothetical protein